MDYIYIFGAGASAGKYSSYGRDSWLMEPQYVLKPSNKTVLYDQVIPTIYRIADRVEAMSIRLKNNLDSSHFEATLAEKIDLISKKLDELSWILNRESFPDIYAETLYSINKKQFDEFIKIFNLYLIIEQMFSGVDKRYKVFFTNLIRRTGDKILPQNIKIFSWNYDYQMEEAFYEKRPLDSPFDEFMNALLIKPQEFSKIQTSFVSVKLNGYAPMLTHKEQEITNDETFKCISTSNPLYYKIDEAGRKNRTQLIGRRMVELYNCMFEQSFSPSLRFAWQYESAQEIITEMGKIKGSIDANEIIVIGYSFPTLNIKIDTALLRMFRKPFKIYLQVNKDDFETIKARVEAILKSISADQREIIFVDPHQDFFIPFNLLRHL